MKSMSQIAFEVATEWTREGRNVGTPGDEPSPEEEIAFWDEVERRFEAHSDDE